MDCALERIPSRSTTLGARLGLGMLAYVWSVLTDGTQQVIHASQSTTNALHGHKMEIALHAIQDAYSRMELVHCNHQWLCPTKDAEHGTGVIWNALNVRSDGYSTSIECAYLLTLIVLGLLRCLKDLGNAYNATKGTF